MVLMILFLVIGFVLLVKGADLFVDGACDLSAKLRIPAYIVGLTVVAFGTSLPEAAVSITASLQGSNEIAIGQRHSHRKPRFFRCFELRLLCVRLPCPYQA